MPLGDARVTPVPRTLTSPEPGTRDELRTARALSRAMGARIRAAIAADYPATVDPPEHRRRWRWLTRLMRWRRAASAPAAYVTADWARQWPAGEIRVARKRAP